MIEEYTPTFNIRNNGYIHLVTKDNIEVECFDVYLSDEHILSNPPSHTKLIEEIITLLRGSGISKIGITFLSENLEKGK